jgi:hypothetical protein
MGEDGAYQGTIFSCGRNFAVDWVAHLLRIREIVDSNLDSETRYSDYGQSSQPD